MLSLIKIKENSIDLIMRWASQLISIPDYAELIYVD